MRFLTPQEIHCILKIAQTYYPDFYPLLPTAILTGMRRGELIALTWDDINWVEHKISVNKSFYKGRITTPKTATSIRKVDMPEKLVKS